MMRITLALFSALHITHRSRQSTTLGEHDARALAPLLLAVQRARGSGCSPDVEIRLAV